MNEEYITLATAMKALTQPSGTTSEPDRILPVAENEWNPRPDAESYGIIQNEFEADSMDGDNLKKIRAFEGSMDLFSRRRDGGGWPQLIEEKLTEHCESCWRLNLDGKYETETSLFHWEWVFQTEG